MHPAKVSFSLESQRADGQHSLYLCRNIAYLGDTILMTTSENPCVFNTLNNEGYNFIKFGHYLCERVQPWLKYKAQQKSSSNGPTKTPQLCKMPSKGHQKGTQNVPKNRLGAPKMSHLGQSEVPRGDWEPTI